MIDERNRLRLKGALIEPFGPPKPNLEQIALVSLERSRVRRTLGRVLALTAFVVFMALAASIALASRMLRDNSGPVRQSPQPITRTLAQLRQLPLALPALRPDGSCPVSSVETKNVYFKKGPNQAITEVVIGNRGPIYGLPGPETTGDHGYYYQVTYLGDARYQGFALVRGRRLDGTQQLIFAGPMATGSLVTTDTVYGPGTSIQFFDELVLPPGPASIPVLPTSPPSIPVWRQWHVTQGVPGAGCYGIQIDGPSFHDTLVVWVPQGG
jgi:hypothetical protein